MSKENFYRMMGWCDCDVCEQTFTVYEDYETHKCRATVNMRQRKFDWTLNDDDTTGTV